MPSIKATSASDAASNNHQLRHQMPSPLRFEWFQQRSERRCYLQIESFNWWSSRQLSNGIDTIDFDHLNHRRLNKRIWHVCRVTARLPRDRFQQTHNAKIYYAWPAPSLAKTARLTQITYLHLPNERYLVGGYCRSCYAKMNEFWRKHWKEPLWNDSQVEVEEVGQNCMNVYIHNGYNRHSHCSFRILYINTHILAILSN